MYIDIVVACFDSAEKAEIFRSEFAATDPLNQVNSVVFIRKADGQLVFKNTIDPDSASFNTEEEIPEDIADIIFQTAKVKSAQRVDFKDDLTDALTIDEKSISFVDKMRMGLLEKFLKAAGISTDFLKELDVQLQPGTSALLILLESGDVSALVEQLRGQCNAVLQATMDSDFDSVDSLVKDNQNAFIRKMIELQVEESRNHFMQKVSGFVSWLKGLFQLNKKGGR